ncbi:MAG: type IVB secretion system protein IcmH/DotU [Gammaproteobacteria bacterium]|nr:type IVB secretion system protein IcmH/DotU [Gammaproteobacteria bacterium]
MADENVIASLLPLVTSTQSEPGSRGYYRSKLFSVQDALSPFVSAANPIFSLLDRFSAASFLPAVDKVRVNIEHELRAYHSRLQSQPHSETQNAIAYYLLCVTIDEVLVRSYLRLYQRAPVFKAFTPASYSEEEPGEKFFSLLSHLKKRPFDHLPLLELAYYCLMAGFEGKQHQRPDGRQRLEDEIDELFRLIQQYRQEVRRTLFEQVKGLSPIVKPYKQLIIIGCCLLVSLWVAFDLSQFFLERQAKKIRFAPTFITTLDE